MKRHSEGHERPREARLRAASAHLFPGVTAEVWIQAATMADIVWAARLRRGEGSHHLGDRTLDPAHFDFRYGGSGETPAAPLRRRASDRLRPHGD